MSLTHSLKSWLIGKDLMRACEIANGNSEVLAIERELDDLRDEISEPWDHPATR